MTTLEQLAAIVDGNQSYTLMDRDPLVALSHLHAVARARAGALGSMAVNDVHLATRTVLRAVDLALELAQPARELPAVHIDGDGDAVLDDHLLAEDDARGWSFGLREQLRATCVPGTLNPDEVERYADFLHACVAAVRKYHAARDALRTEHAAAIDALRAAGWTVTEP